ncbi:hypothetical protein SAMN06265360_101269 [Haloechinothrix alba]|uniref:Uncharacterized protein n=1 Tax=Haloechinothrix alba TaxID=664784 RepID=A0A238V402_9PSEU|nr:hypothetical protein [Haloechinothrix alba]SNR28834.1 hypothetical protein SAMN06265360_101269 [Haloechinothrix alba]
MFTTVATWVGALLGIAILIAMAVGAVAIDFDALRKPRKGIRRRKNSTTPSG